MHWIGIAIGGLTAAAAAAWALRERTLFITALGLLYLVIWRAQYNSIGRYRRIAERGERMMAKPVVKDAPPAASARLPALWARGQIETKNGPKEVTIPGLRGDPPQSPIPVKYLPRYPGHAVPDAPGGLKKYARFMVYCNLAALLAIGLWLAAGLF